MPDLPIGRALALLAARDPDRVAVHETATGRALTRRDLDRARRARARAWREQVGVDDRIAVVLSNGADLVVACAAIWTLGATPVPVDPRLDADGLADVLATVAPALVVDEARMAAPAPDGADDLPDRWASSWKGTASGGSTGRPKIVLSTGAARVDPDADVAPYLPRDQVQLVCGPMHHSAPFTYALRGLMTGHTLVVLPRFEPGEVLDAVARHRVTWALWVPTMLHRLARHPGIDAADLSPLRAVLHLGAPCPPPLKRWWLDRLGDERVVEVYASAESSGITMVRGDEWRAHPGTVGRPVGGSEFRVVSPDGTERAAGEIGEVVMRRAGGPRYRYLGADARRLPGWEAWDALGDLGWLDAEGYLFLVDRAVDTLAVRRGDDTVEVHPARVEAVLETHPDVRSSAVVGLPGTDGGARVHALLDLDGPGGDAAADRVVAAVAGRLRPEEVPASAESVPGPLRDDAGKVNRRALRDARIPPP